MVFFFFPLVWPEHLELGNFRVRNIQELEQTEFQPAGLLGVKRTDNNVEIHESRPTVEKSKSSRKGDEAGGVRGWRSVLAIHEQAGDTRLGREYHRATPGMVAEDE